MDVDGRVIAYLVQEASLPELYRLRDCATQRIITYLQQKFALLRQPRTNINIIQRAELLRHKELFLFLTDQAPEMAVAVKDDYVRTISAVYVALFKSYNTQLLGLLSNAYLSSSGNSGESVEADVNRPYPFHDGKVS